MLLIDQVLDVDLRHRQLIALARIFHQNVDDGL
jgi:hypothetical protein